MTHENRNQLQDKLTTTQMAGYFYQRQIYKKTMNNFDIKPFVRKMIFFG